MDLLLLDYTGIRPRVPSLEYKLAALRLGCHHVESQREGLLKFLYGIQIGPSLLRELDVPSQSGEELLKSYQNSIQGVMISVSEAQIGILLFVVACELAIVGLHPQLPLYLSLQQQALHPVARVSHVDHRYRAEILNKLVPLPLQGRQ